MRGKAVSSPWRIVQQFISEKAIGIFEVEVNTDTKVTRCNCPVFGKKNVCKHTQFVDFRIKSTGHYSILIPEDIPEEMATDASDDPVKFREFVVKHAKIEVL